MNNQKGRQQQIFLHTLISLKLGKHQNKSKKLKQIRHTFDNYKISNHFLKFQCTTKKFVHES